MQMIPTLLYCVVKTMEDLLRKYVHSLTLNVLYGMFEISYSIINNKKTKYLFFVIKQNQLAPISVTRYALMILM